MNFSCLHLFLLALTFIGDGCMANCACNSNSCYRSSQKLLVPATEEIATIEAKCSAVCVDKLFQYCQDCQLVPNTESQWSSFNYFQPRNNCTVYQKIKDCQRGCIIRSKDVSSTQCSDQCMLQCPNTTMYDSFPDSCNVSCSSFACASGCQIFNETRKNSSLVSSPLSSPSVLSAINNPSYYKDGGQCLYSVAGTAQPISSGGGEDIVTKPLMTTFVFKIDKENGTTYYISVEAYSGVLDLGFLSCECLTISYKAVTALGESVYSESITLTLDGRETPVAFPTQVTSVNAFITEDFRDGFSGHAITTLSWPKPNNSDYLTHYNLIVLSHTKHCGGVNIPHLYCINKDVTNFTIISETPDKPFFLRCRYSIRLTSEPKLDTSNVKTFSINTESVSDTRPPLSVHCTREFQSDGKLTVYAAWDVSYKNGLFDAMEKYVVSLQVFDYSTRSIVPDYQPVTTEVFPNINQSLNVYFARDLQVLENVDRRFMIRVDAVSNHEFPWRLMPAYGKCAVDSSPEPPSILNISTIIIKQLLFTDTQLLVSLSWGPPLVANGNVTTYELRIARDPILPFDFDDSNVFSYKHKVKQTLSTVIRTDAIYQLSEVACLNLQIRSMNDYLWSNWSDPLLLSKYSNNPSCDNIAVEAPEPTTQRAIESIVVGAVFGGLGAFVLLGLMFAGAVVLCRRYRRRNRYLEAFKDSNADSLYIKSPLSPGIFTSRPVESPQLDEWEIPANLVVIEKRLGEGCFGEVYQGVVKGPINNSKVQASFKNAICPIVAVKLLKSTATGSEKMDFLQEIDTMKTVSKANNPHVVNLVGCVTIQEPLCLITEFVKHGDLLSYLQSIRKMITQRQLLEAAGSPTVNTHNSTPYMLPSLNSSPLNESPSMRLSIAVPSPESPYAELGEIDSVNLLSFAYQIASGMEFLASLGIIHRDLACRNILVDDGKCLKISDFGMSRMVAANDVYVKNTRGRLPWKWMAIESILNREFTSASDVWSYGVTLWEIATLGGFPYPTVTNAELLDHLQKGVRLEKPENCSQDVYEIMLECWQPDPHKRLTFTELRAKFDSLISAQQGHSPYIDLEIDYGKSYYTSLVEDSDDDDEDREDVEGSPSTCEGDIPLEMRYDAIRPMLNNSETISRPIENPYVDTPTKLATCGIVFDLSAGSINDPCPSDIPQSPLKKKLTEIV